MLTRVLDTIADKRHPITITELSQELNIERNALEGMIQFWVRKGRLWIDKKETGNPVCSCTINSDSCGSLTDSGSDRRMLIQNTVKQKK
jgi:hypothetical protein